MTITGAKGGTLARSDIAGIIGGDPLERFRVIYDCPNARQYLEPGKDLDEPFEEDMSGIRSKFERDGARRELAIVLRRMV